MNQQEVTLTQNQVAAVVVDIIERSYPNESHTFRELCGRTVGSILDGQLAGRDEIVVEEDDLSNLIACVADLSRAEIAKGMLR